jgi:acyl carrier protein
MHNRICHAEPGWRKGMVRATPRGTWGGNVVVMNSPDPTLEEILNLAAVHFKVPREKLQPDDDFFKTLGIDSLQTLDLLTKLEHHFRVELPDYELQGVSDFRTLADRIRARL